MYGMAVAERILYCLGAAVAHYRAEEVCAGGQGVGRDDKERGTDLCAAWTVCNDRRMDIVQPADDDWRGGGDDRGDVLRQIFRETVYEADKEPGTKQQESGVRGCRGEPNLPLRGDEK